MTMLKKWQRPKPCTCGGYWFPHRTGGGACEHNGTQGIAHLARRHGWDALTTLDAMIDFAWNNKGKEGTKCPF